ncbi:MAG: hypothetical protein PQJ60_02710 [Spirochaetales bacterium]|nr:hypothetical protein [Spirochaetales bacterium]
MVRLRLLPLFLLLSLPFLAAEENEQNGLEKGLEAFSQFEAFSLESRIYGELYSEDSEGAYQWDLSFMPTLHYAMGEKMEFAPYLLFRIEMESNDEGIVDTDVVHTDLNRLTLGAGAGFYWTLIDTNHIDILTGFSPEVMVIFPQWGDSSPTGYYSFDPGYGSLACTVDVPLGFSVNPSDRLTFRLWVEMIRMGAKWDEEYYQDDIIDRTITFFSYSPFWNEDWTPSTYDDWIPYPSPVSFSFIWNL